MRVRRQLERLELGRLDARHMREESSVSTRIMPQVKCMQKRIGEAETLSVT